MLRIEDFTYYRLLIWPNRLVFSTKEKNHNRTIDDLLEILILKSKQHYNYNHLQLIMAYFIVTETEIKFIFLCSYAFTSNRWRTL